jgi:uncharacterized protein
VLRVMFTAIVTCMLGLYFLDLFGVLPLGSIGILDTYLPSQLAGGLLLGAGFIIGGYCPGTSIVASASGKIDGLVFVVGLIAGSTIFTVGYDALAGFHKQGAWGRVLISDFLHLPTGVVVFGVTVFALVAFWAVKHIERLVNARRVAP